MTDGATQRTTRNAMLIAAVGWCLVFAGVHVYWAVGGRGALGVSATHADAALGNPRFAAYNAAVGLASLAGAGGASALLRRTLRPRRLRAVATIARLTSIALLARGVLGCTLIAYEAVTAAETDSPLLLLLVEPWFVIGGLLARQVAHLAASRAAANDTHIFDRTSSTA